MSFPVPMKLVAVVVVVTSQVSLGHDQIPGRSPEQADHDLGRHGSCG